MTLRTRLDIVTVRGAVELMSDKVGTVLFVLGIMHFFNLFLFSRFRRRALDRLATAPPPIPPTGSSRLNRASDDALDRVLRRALRLVLRRARLDRPATALIPVDCRPAREPSDELLVSRTRARRGRATAPG